MENRKLILSLFMIGTAIILAGAGTWAYFIDTETSNDNSLIAGTLDINISHSFNFQNVPPGAYRTESIDVENIRSVVAKDVYLEVDVTDQEISDDTDAERDDEINSGITNEPGTMRGETDISKWIQITEIKYNNVNIINLYSNINGNTYIDLDDLNRAGLVKVNNGDMLSPGEVAYVNFTMLFDPYSGNELQGDRAVVNETVIAIQT